MTKDSFQEWYHSVVALIEEALNNEFQNQNILSKADLEKGVKNLKKGDDSVSDVIGKFMTEEPAKGYVKNDFIEWYMKQYFYEYAIDHDEWEFPEWPRHIRGQVMYVLIAPLMFPM